MEKIRTCEKHDLAYHEDEGCEYCYKEWQDKQNLIKEFLDDLSELWEKNAEGYHSNNTYAEIIEEYQKKWEQRLK